MNTPVASLFDNGEYFQTYFSPFPNGGKKEDDITMELDPPPNDGPSDLLVRLYLGSLTIVGLYILFRALD